MAIQQHPLPQDISSYRFRLIGDMTIKQFASLGICIVLGIIAYSLPLPFFFKYPLAFMFIVLGVGMAFVPVQGRSLDVWILAFIRSIYSPTQYTWQRVDSSTEMSISTSSSAGTQAVSNARIELTQAPVPNTPAVTITPPLKDEAANDKTQAPKEELKPEFKHEPSHTETPIPSLNQPVMTSSPAPTPLSTPVTKKIEDPAPTPKPQTMSESQLPIPFTPTTPNTLVGLTLNTEGRILDGVLVEIQRNGLTSRATKSNKLGQFMFARPLENGLYQILAEKESFTFAPYSLDLTGEIIRPLKIQAQ